MTANEIKGELLKKGLRVTDVARALKLTPGHVHYVINRQRSSPNVQEYIAKAIGKPESKVFPPSAA